MRRVVGFAVLSCVAGVIPVVYAHQGAHLESTLGTRESVTDAYYALRGSSTQYAIPGAIGSNSAHCPAGFSYLTPTGWPNHLPARCRHNSSNLSFVGWVMADMPESCVILSTGGTCRGGNLQETGSGCGERLYVKSQADCASCGSAVTYVFLSTDGTNWVHSKTISNSGTSITDTFVSGGDFRYVLLGRMATGAFQVNSGPRWMDIYTAPETAGCF